MAKQLPVTPPADPEPGPIKSGARHSSSDQSHIDAAKEGLDQVAEHLVAAGAAQKPKPQPNANPSGGDNSGNPSPKSLDVDPADTLVFSGDAVKALGDGRIGGYLVRWGNENEPDLSASRDFFTDKTYFGAHAGDGCDVTLNHGIPLKAGKAYEELADVLLPPMKTKKDSIGLFAETACNLADDYQKMVYDLASKGKLSWSSGALSHQMKRTHMPNGTNRIDRWIIGEGALTPTPAEPRLGNVVPLKSLSGLLAEALDSATPAPASTPDGVKAAAATLPETPAVPVSTPSRSNEMTPEELKALQDNTEAVKALQATQDAIKKQNEDLLTEARKPALKTTPAQSEPATPAGVFVNPFKSIGENVFAIRDKQLNRSPSAEQINKLEAVKANALKVSGGANELIASEGGDLVHTQFSNEIFQKVYSAGQIASRVSKQLIGPGANGLKIPAVDEQSRVDGSRWGGIQAYWAAEAATITASKPTWRQVVFELKKLTALVYSSDELERDQAAFGSFLGRVLPLEIQFKVEDGILNGRGGGYPLGILNAAATVSVAKEANQPAATVVWENIKKMRARMWAACWPNSAWFVHQDTLSQLYGLVQVVGVGGVPVFLPATGASGSPYDTLFGRPVIPVEQAQTLGTVGDIVYADLTQYAVADNGDGVQAAMSLHVAFINDQMTYRWTYRLDGEPLWNTALTPYKGTNTFSPFITLATRS